MILQGIMPGVVKMATKKQIGRLTSSSRGTCTLLMSSIIHSEHQTGVNEQKWPPDLQQLLK